MTKRLTLICQGATNATRRGIFPVDEALEAGAALPAAPKPLHGRGWSVLVSPRLAARQTAERLSLVATVDTALDDIDCGDWAGRSIAEIAEAQPREIERWILDPDYAGHGGESRSALAERATAWLARRAEDEPHALAVTHAAFIRSLVLSILDAPVSAFWRIDIAPASVTDIRHDGRRWTIRSLGCLPQSGV